MKCNDFMKIIDRSGLGKRRYAVERTVYCDGADNEAYVDPYGVPSFRVPDASDAVIAAGNAVVCFNRLCPRLVPDYRAHVNAHGEYKYGDPTDGVLRMFDRLKELCAAAKGDAFDRSVYCMKEYAREVGVAVAFTDIADARGVRFELLKAGLRRGELAVMMFDGYAVAEDLRESDGCRTVTHVAVEENTVALVYGFMDAYCYDGETKVGRERYLNVLDGHGEPRIFALDCCIVDRACLVAVRRHKK